MNVDFKLASTYIPVFISILKMSILVFLFFVITNKGHFMSLAGLLQLDHIYTNFDYIVDISATLHAWLFFQLIAIERQTHGFVTSAGNFVCFVWALAPLFRFSTKYDMTYCLVCIIVICNIHFDVESLAIQFSRAVMFNLYIMVSIYVAFFHSQTKQQLQVIFQGGVILCGHLIIATSFFLIATVVLIYSCLQEKSETVVTDLEAQALRQALALKKSANVKD